MKFKTLLIGLAALYAIVFALWLSLRASAPIASPTSPAIGAWRHGGLGYVLKVGGTGRQVLGRHSYPLRWTEKNGVVTLDIHDPTAIDMEQVGELSPNKRTLHITQSSARSFPTSLYKMKTNLLLQKQ